MRRQYTFELIIDKMSNKKSNWSNKIYYSQCWEDSEFLLSSLKIKSKNSHVLSILSGGENVFALAISPVKKIIAIDSNSAQCYLMELKFFAIKILDYNELLLFLGYRKCKDRQILYKKLEPFLTTNAKIWWSNHLYLVKKGIAWQGKLEKYFQYFRLFVLPFLIKKKNLIKILNEENKDTRKKYWQKYTNESYWCFFFKIFCSRFIMSILGRNPEMFRQVTKKNIGLYYYFKLKKMILNGPVDNFYLKAILLKPTSYDNLPFCYKKENFKKLKKSLDKIYFLHYNLLDYLKLSFKNNYKFDIFNLSDIFEPLNQSDSDKLFTLLYKLSSNDVKLAYWCNLVSRKPLNQNWKTLEKNYNLFDKVFIYSEFNLYTKK